MDHRIVTQVMTIPYISASRMRPVFFMDVDEIGYDKIGAVKTVKVTGTMLIGINRPTQLHN